MRIAGLTMPKKNLQILFRILRPEKILFGISRPETWPDSSPLQQEQQQDGGDQEEDAGDEGGEGFFKDLGIYCDQKR